MPSEFRSFELLRSQRAWCRLMAPLAAALLGLLAVSSVSAAEVPSDVALKVVRDNDNLMVLLVNESIGEVTVNGRFAFGSIVHDGADLELRIVDENGKAKPLAGHVLIRDKPKDYAVVLNPGQIIGESFRICDIKRYYGLTIGYYKMVAKFQTDSEYVFLKSTPAVIESNPVSFEVNEQGARCILIPSGG